MSALKHDTDPQSSEKKTVDLFFGALFRLGVWTGDWETWYGTRPLGPLPRNPYPTPELPRVTTRQRPR